MERDPDSYKSQRESQLRIHARGLGADGETVVGSGVGAITTDQRCSLEKGALQPRILGEEDRQPILQDCNKPNLNIACWEDCSQKENSVCGGLFEVTSLAKAVVAVIRACHQLLFASFLEGIGWMCEHRTPGLPLFHITEV